MSDAPGLLAAFAAGSLSFLSPCVLPLIPVYLSLVTGESVSALKEGRASRAFVFARSILFVLGFSLVFVVLAIAFGGGMSFAGNRALKIVEKIGGILMIVLALNMIFDFIPFLRRDWRPAEGSQKNGGERQAASPLASALMGMAFATGWTPCVGPILSSILLYAGSSGDVARSAALLSAYSLGLGIPFVAAGLFLDRLLPFLAAAKRQLGAIKIATAGLLIVLAVPLVVGITPRALIQSLFSSIANIIPK